MRIVVVHAVGKVFADVSVDVDLPSSPTLEAIVDALPGIAETASVTNPDGSFAGLEFVEGEQSDWTVEGRAANGRPWTRSVEAPGPGEASFLAIFAILEESRAVRPSDVARLVESMRAPTIVSVEPERSAPAP